MARPYINTSDKNGSPMTPMSERSNTPISYRANVNRQKTKKWAEAKKIDYGGDDWGDDDEYDGYGYEPEPQPAPVSKPTGFRQKGQGLYGMREQSLDRGQKSYGTLQSGSAGAAPPNRGRSNSFEADDEQRHFSYSTTRSQHQPTANTTPPTSGPVAGPATRFSQMIGGVRHTRDPSGSPLSISTQRSSPTGLRKPSPANNAPQPEQFHSDIPQSIPPSGYDSSILSPGSANTMSDYENSRNYSPSAVPAPLSMRGSPSPVPHSTTDSQSTKFPVRKSSLNTMRADRHRNDQPRRESLDSKPWIPGSDRSSSPGAARSAISPGASNKALPFIRPADIYRRAEEERRASLDSGRPSMDSLGMGQSSERSQSPGQGGVRERSSSDSLGPSNLRRPSLGDESSDSGRRRRPILESVTERKSEYGFDGFNTDDIISADQKVANSNRETTVQELNDNDSRRLSVSPKLPDLHRISGFGTDFFSQSKPELEDTHTVQNKKQEQQHERTAPTADANNQSAEETTLRSQPSLGFRSVVNQAFDRRTDNSVPPTPASPTSSDIKRTGSESTSTTGISPIMSRVPSSALPDNRGRATTPAIMEVMEPSSPSERVVQNVATEKEEQLPANFIPGHRRDISTPSPGNSPARTPDIAKAKRLSMGEHAWISSGSPTLAADDDDEPLEAPRPLLERDTSFRPQLPGGWQSYATTATASTVQADNVRSRSPERLNVESGDMDPSTTEHPSLRSSSKSPAMLFGAQADSMPTPDPAMAPSGNLYSAMEPDPRLVPTREEAPPEAQLRANAPTEPRADETSQSLTPTYGALVSESTRSASPSRIPEDGMAPTIQGISEADDASHVPLPPERVQTMSSLEDSPSDEESDKLRKEIVKSLSSGHLGSKHDQDNVHDSPNLPSPRQARESSYLTDVYDDYWADTTEEGNSSPLAKTSSHPMPAREPQIPSQSELPEIRPLSSHKMSQQLRPPLATRFSWERSTESIPKVVMESEIPARDTEVSETSETSNENSNENLREVEPVPEFLAEKEVVMDSPSETDHHLNKGAALLAGGTALGSAAVHAGSADPPPTFNVSSPESDDNEQSSGSHTGMPSQPDNEPTSAFFGNTIDPLGSHPPSPSPTSNVPVKRDRSPTPRTPATATPKIPSFKEIVATQDVHQRIRIFNETRECFAAMDSGLQEWILALQAQHAEHEDVTASFGGFQSSISPGTARSKHTKSAGPGTLQAPYYQQYLNASSPTQPSTPTSRPGPSVPAGTQQGFSQTGAKLTTHQVQAKGKEFLHSAGVFGGKAGKAGKGLLAKGKNRLRSAGGSDKVD